MWANPLVAPAARAADTAWDLLGLDATAHVRQLSDRAASGATPPMPSSVSSTTNSLGPTGPRVADALLSMEALDDKHPLGVGDHLSLRIVEDREEAKEFVVTDSGELDVPYVGRVAAKGRTCRDLAVEIKRLLELDYYRRATVILAIDAFNRTRGRVYVFGQVRSTGALEIPASEPFTLSKALLLSGGFTEFADRKRVKISRRQGPGETALSQVIDAAEILDKGRLEKDVELQPEDLVVVPARWLNF